MAAAHEVAPDALPYFDLGYDVPGVREMVSLLSKPMLECNFFGLCCQMPSKRKNRRNMRDHSFVLTCSVRFYTFFLTTAYFAACC